MSEIEDRTVDGIDCQIARILGCEQQAETTLDVICSCGEGKDGVSQRWPAIHWLDSEGYVPRWSESLDACFGPGGPVEYAKAKGWGWIVDASDGIPMVSFVCGGKGWATDVENQSFPRALSLAFLAAAEATK